MRKVFIVISIMFACAAYAQKPAQKPVEKTETQAPQNPSPQQISPMAEHFAKKSSLANRWNDTDEIKDALYDLIAEYPGNDSLIYSLAIYYYDNQKYVSSVLVTQDLLARNPKNVGLLQLAASGFEELGIKDKALTNYESVYLINGNTGVLYKMAVLQFDLKKYAECQANVDILLTKPDTETIKVTLSDAANKQKDYPIKASILNLKGMLAEQTGDKVTAKKSFEDALKVASDFPLAKQNLAKLK
jgi:tetratricopeptide (TPR) repeat protein